jgi:hypothetical protein
VWSEDVPAVENYEALGQALAATGDLYRRPGYADGLLLGSPAPYIEPTPVVTAAKLRAVAMDRLRVRVLKDGNNKAGGIPAAHLGTMLHTEAFLQSFLPVDEVRRSPRYLANFELTRFGYNDAGRGQRVLYFGPEPRVAEGLDAINRFLDVMAFDTEADRTNAIAAALTIMLRHHWPGAKPCVLVTSTMSHGGKDTTIQFACGSTPSVSISYQQADWALERSFVGALKHCPQAGVVVVDNARLARGVDNIASAFLERFITDPEPLLFSTGTGPPTRGPNNLVVAISTNFGMVSQDLMNRALPIHLHPVGNVADRELPIGNPKLDYLPKSREDIDAEHRGMIERWLKAGRPLDKDVKHPFTSWGQTIGGILMVNNFKGFLANIPTRRTADDPVQRALGLLGAGRPEEWLPASAWAPLAVELGLVQPLIPQADRGTEASRARGLGHVLSVHQKQTFHGETEDATLTLLLEKGRRRFENGVPSTRYRFDVLKREAIPEDPEGDAPTSNGRLEGANGVDI